MREIKDVEMIRRI